MSVISSSLILSASSASAMYYAFDHTDGMGKFIIFILFLGSIITWTIMLEKGVGLYKAMKASEEFISLFREKRFPQTIGKKAEQNISPIARVYENGFEKLITFYNISPERAEMYGTAHCPIQKLTTAEMETIRTTMERTVSDQILRLEDRVGMLGTAVSISPFLGLFGTVWGITLAFTSFGQLGRADMGGLAPGISGALMTTIVGLVVAIPSLAGYNLTTLTIRKITVYMDNFVEEFMAKLKLEQFEAEESSDGNKE